MMIFSQCTMPNRAKKAGNTLKKTTYMDVLRELNAHIIREYKSITGFTRSPAYTKCGFSADEAPKIVNYLSLPKDGADKKVKSLPVMVILYRVLLSRKLSFKVIVTREYEIFIE